MTDRAGTGAAGAVGGAVGGAGSSDGSDGSDGSDSNAAIRALGDFADDFFEREVFRTLSDYVGIRCLSPDFDPEWEANGEIDRAVELLAGWARARAIPGVRVEVLKQPGLTPVIVAEVPAAAGPGGRAPQTATLIYGHLDKQPPLGAWREGLDPFTPVREGDRLYGRGTADDGYSIFAALGALEALAAHGHAHGRCVVLIEASEESGSSHLDAYLDDVAERAGPGGPDLVVCLDSGCATYDRLWATTSLRGNAILTLTVDVLTEGVHSGSAGAVVPSSFRILRALLSRIEDEETGEILVPECNAAVPERLRKAAEDLARDLGDAAIESFPIVPGLELAGGDVAGRLLARTYAPSLSVTGASGLPALHEAGNVLRPSTSVKLSLRLPPSVDPSKAARAVADRLGEDAPSRARVTVEIDSAASGFEAPEAPEWLARAGDLASLVLFGNSAGAVGAGGTIPFLAELQARFPGAQFLVTGVLGPGSNAHGPNEMLDLLTAKRVTASVAHVIASAP